MPTPPGAIDRQANAIGSPRYLGTLAATTTSGTFPPAGSTDLSGKVLLISVVDSTGTTRVHPVASSAGTVTGSRTGNHGVPWTDGDIKIVTMTDKDTHVAAICSVGTANVDFWELIA